MTSCFVDTICPLSSELLSVCACKTLHHKSSNAMSRMQHECEHTSACRLFSLDIEFFQRNAVLVSVDRALLCAFERLKS